MKKTLRREDLGPDFQLGVATSAYQIEGAVAEDGRKPSIWDRFAHTPGKTKQGDHGDVACDHYHRMQEDVALLGWLGVDAYRFSIAWPRVVPEGRGAVNQRGLDFYERLVDALLERGIAPAATLYHWDLPDALPGGWLSRDTTEAFAEYAQVVSQRLGDRVALWLTHNEPWCQAFLGYETGLFAPGHRDLGEALLCAHHLLVSHGLAVQALRANVRGPVGIALNFMPAHPACDTPADIAAARRVDGYFNRWFVEPVTGRGYPGDMVELYGAAMPKVTPADLALISAPVDVLGVNYYERAVVAHDPTGGVLAERRLKDTGLPRTLDREVYPPGLMETLRWLHRDLGFQRLVITENGAAYDDVPTSEGDVHDEGRVEFLRAHLEQLVMARREGLPVEAYFAWSLLDNFEWSEGYTLRYGLVHVDFATQRRIAKASAHFLRGLAPARPGAP
ncbi:MAG TPA: GH1 family beta-glucosidase [Polyangiaceae bacterium]|nr:GH1 family beta-glucosidase [Polyangiaceae bacterium]